MTLLRVLIAEGHSYPAIPRELFDRHISHGRETTIADIERGEDHGEFAADVDPVLLVDAIFAPNVLTDSAAVCADHRGV